MTDYADQHAAPLQSAVNKRRSFLQQLGMGMSAVLGSTAFASKANAGNDLRQQVARLEAEKALRVLHQRYEQAMDEGSMEQALALFTDDAEVVFNGGIFSGREQGLRRLYLHHFAQGKTGKRMEAAPGFAVAEDQQQERVAVAADASTATAVFTYSIQAGRPIESDSSLASMARLHGEGVHSWWEGGVYEVDYVKDVDGAWKITRLAYNTLSRADYRTGRSCASPITVPAFSACFPNSVHGPDRLA